MATVDNLNIQISADASKATKSLDNLISKLNQLNSAMGSINTSGIQNISKYARSGGSYSGSGYNNSDIDNSIQKTTTLMNTLTKKANSTQSAFLKLNSITFKLASTFGMFYASAYPFIRFGEQIGNAVQDAMTYVETYNYYSVTMKKIGEESGEEYVNSFKDTVNNLTKKMTGYQVGTSGALYDTGSTNLGLDPEQLMSFQAKVGAVTNSVGLLSDESMYAQKALSMLSADLSSLTNTDIDTVMTNLQSGLIGQSRALYKYGIDITQATLKQVAYEHGITQSVSSMTQAQKMELRLIAILEQSKVAWSDQAQTLGSVANQYRILQQQLSNLTRVLGNLFLPIVQKVLPYINAVVIAIRKVFTLLGLKIYGNNWLTDTLDGISSGGVSDIADSADDASDALDSATDSAKKLKNATMGFDELNVIDTSSSSGSSGSGSSGGSLGLGDDINDLLMEYEDIWDKALSGVDDFAQKLANRIYAYFERGDFNGLGKWISDNLANALNKIDWQKIYAGARSFGTGLADFLNGLIQPSTFYTVGQTLARSLNTAIYFALSLGEELKFDQIGKAIASYWNGIFENFDFKSFGKTVGVWVGGICQMISNAITHIKWDELFDGIKEAIEGFFEGFFEKATIKDLAITIGVITVKKILELSWGAMALKVVSTSLAKALASRFAVDLGSNVTLSNAISLGLTNAFKNAKLNFQSIISNLINVGSHSLSFNTLNESMTRVLGSAMTNLIGIGNVLSGLALSVHEFIDMWQNGWDGISEVIKDVGIALTALGAVMLGVCTGGVATLVAGIAMIGSTVLVLAHEQLPKLSDMVVETLTNPNGISVSELCSETAESIASIGDGFFEITEKSQTLEATRNEIAETCNSIDLISVEMDNGVLSVTEGTEQLKTQFANLLSSAQTYFQGIDEEILLAFGENGAYHEAMEQAGVDTESFISDITGLNASALEEIENLTNEYINLDDKTGARAQQIRERIAELTGQTDTAGQAITDFGNTVNGVEIDWSSIFLDDGSVNTDAITEGLGTISDSLTDTKAKVEESTNSIMEDLQKEYEEAVSMGDSEKASEIQKAMEVLPEAMQTMNDEVDQKAMETENALQLSLVENIPNIIKEAEDKWDEMSFWEKLMSGATNADQYAQQSVEKYKSDYIDPISNQIQSQYDQLGIDGSAWASDASQKIINSLFDTTIISGNGTDTISTYTTTLNETTLQALEDAMAGVEDTAEEYGGYTVDGFTEGIKSKQGESSKNVADWMQVIYDSIHNSAMQFGSPSKATYQFGQDTVTGFVNGINASVSSGTTTTAIDFWMDIVKTEMDAKLGIAQMAYSQTFYEYGKKITDGFNQGLQDNMTSSQETMSSWQEEIKTTFDETWSDAYEAVQDVWSECATWFEDSVITPVEDDFSKMCTNIKDDFKNMWLSVRQQTRVDVNYMISTLQSGLNNMIFGINSFITQMNLAFAQVAKKTGTTWSNISGVSPVTLSQVSTYQNGGFPTTGELYIARENGSELVGRMGNQNVVANNEQIVSGISSGVQLAVAESLAPFLQEIVNNTRTTANKDFTVRIDSRDIVNAYDSRKARNGYAFT